MKKSICLLIIVLHSLFAIAQSEQEKVKKCIENYIYGTSYNQSDSIAKAFYTEANLFLSHKEKPLWIVPITEYIQWFKKGEQGKFNGRLGRVISMDIFNDIATAKAEILIPSKKQEFIDMFLLKKIQGDWKIISKSAGSKESNKEGKRVLMVVANATHYGTSKISTGNSFSEIVSAYNTFIKGGYTVDFLSPHGGAVPLVYIDTSDDLQKQYLYNSDFMYAMSHTSSPKEIEAKNYKAIYYIGGGSILYEVPESKEIQSIAMQIYEDNKGVISSVCHGTAGLVNLKTKDGNYLVKGKKISGYPDSWEKKDADYLKHFPFLIQKTIEERGARFNFSSKNTSYVEVDGRIITGQNFQSASDVAQKVIETIQN